VLSLLYLYVARQTDVKQARYRDDVESDDDKLVSCLSLNCHNIRARLRKAKKKKAGAGASTSGRAKRARPPADEEGAEVADIVEIVHDVDAPNPKTKSKSKSPAPKPKAGTVTAVTPASTPAQGRRGLPQPRSRVRVQVPRSEQGSGVGSSGRTPAATAAPGEVRKRRKVAHTATA
jgi:hypothetical protein